MLKDFLILFGGAAFGFALSFNSSDAFTVVVGGQLFKLELVFGLFGLLGGYFLAHAFTSRSPQEAK